MSKETYGPFRFHYVQDPETPGRIKVYVEDQPSYGSRDTSLSVIHRWNGKNGSPPYICFKEHVKPVSLAEAQRMARDWADRTLVYIRTGTTISQQFARE